MTYNVFGGTLNPTLLLLVRTAEALAWQIELMGSVTNDTVFKHSGSANSNNFGVWFELTAHLF